MAENVGKWLKIAENGWKLLDMAGYYRIWPDRALNGRKRLEIIENYLNWLEMAGNALPWGILRESVYPCNLTKTTTFHLSPPSFFFLYSYTLYYSHTSRDLVVPGKRDFSMLGIHLYK